MSATPAKDKPAPKKKAPAFPWWGWYYPQQ